MSVCCGVPFAWLRASGVRAGQQGLVLKPLKRKSLHLSGSTLVGTRPTTFHGRTEPILHLTDFEGRSFCGRPKGYRVLGKAVTVPEGIDTGCKLLSPMEASWQLLDAVKTFLFPTFNFVLHYSYHYCLQQQCV